jgi:hypothetical protein
MPRHRDKITPKQKKFVREYIKTNGNGTLSAMRSYNAKNKDVAKNIASINLTKPIVQEELQKALNKENARLDKVIDNITNIAVEQSARGYSGSEILEANKVLLKLHGVLTDKKQVTSYNLNTTLNELSEYELRERINKQRKDSDTILIDE